MNDLPSEFEPLEVDSTDVRCSGPIGSEGSRIVSGSAPGSDTRDPCQPSESECVDENPSEHLLTRMRVILWAPHQVYVSGILLAALILMTIFFSFRWYRENGLVDIDQAHSIRAEFKIDINTAELGEIVVLPGIGVKLAQAIIDHRQAAGEFESFEDLCAVPGIGEKTLESIKPYLLPIKPVGLGN